MRSRKYKVHIEPYDALMHLVFCNDLHRASKAFLRKENWKMDLQKDEIDKATFIHGIPDNKEYALIFPIKGLTPGIIVHEVSHLTTMLLTTCGVDIINNDEPNSYLVDHLVDKIWNKYKKLR